jgi:hypothetical protein
MSKKVDKLLDQRYRRTADCLKYFSVVRDRGVHVPQWDDVVRSGKDIDIDYIKSHGMETPIVVGDGLQTLGLKIPNASLSELAAIIGADTPVKVIRNSSIMHHAVYYCNIRIISDDIGDRCREPGGNG